MKKRKRKIFSTKALFLFGIFAATFFLAHRTFADSLVPCGLNGAADCTLCHLVVGFQNVYTYLLTLLSAAATLAIVVSGIMYIVSAGNKAMMDKAKSAFKYALTAIILALTAWLIINVTLNAFGFTNAGSWYSFTCDTTQSVSSGDLSTGVTLPGTGSGSNSASSSSDSNSCREKIVSNIMAMNGWKYELGSWSEGSGDCASTTSRAYTRSGCDDPGGSTGVMEKNSKAKVYSGDPSMVKKGDILFWYKPSENKNGNGKGHAGILLDDEGSVMGASGKNGISPHKKYGLSYIVKQAEKNGATLKVLSASDLCPDSSCK